MRAPTPIPAPVRAFASELTDEQVREFIQKSGLNLVAVYAEDSFDPVQEDTQRIIYVAQKPVQKK